MRRTLRRTQGKRSEVVWKGCTLQQERQATPQVGEKNLRRRGGPPEMPRGQGQERGWEREGVGSHSGGKRAGEPGRGRKSRHWCGKGGPGVREQI